MKSNIELKLKKYCKRKRKVDVNVADELHQIICSNWDKIAKCLCDKRLNDALAIIMLPIMNIAAKKSKIESGKFNDLYQKNHRMVRQEARKMLSNYLPLSQTRYMKCYGNICPICKSSFVYTFQEQIENIKLAGGVLEVHYECDECGAEWAEAYKLSGYHIKEQEQSR
jgi:DNA-directed RNA polymerase subunit M/transcription elongation factor TFIIS